MNFGKSFPIVCALLGASLVLASNEAKATDYPLYCRGGVTNTIGLDTFVTNNYPSNGYTTYDVIFNPGTRAWGGVYTGITTISPGECQWADRAFRSGEYTTLEVEAYDDYNYWTITPSNHSIYLYSAAISPWYAYWTDSNAIILFMVHSDNQSHQIVDSAVVLSH